MLDMLAVGEEIATQRKARGLTQTELAARARVSRATITALETGRQRELGFNKLMAILAVLGLDMRITAENARRPTLEDLRREADR
jgi:transcriptional regulator with XRE-family HTH domain